MALYIILGARRRGSALLAAVAVVALLAPAGRPSIPAQASPSAPTFTVNSPIDAPSSTLDAELGVCRTATINTTCTLRAAIMKANRFPGGGVTIIVPNDVYTLTVAAAGPDDDQTGDLNITQTVTIQGAGAAGTIIDANASGRIFFINLDTTVVISSMTLRNGLVTDGGGAIYNYGNLTLAGALVTRNTAAANLGGGIYNAGHLILDHSRLEANKAPFGGGLHMRSGSSAEINFSAISGNRASQAGAGITSGGNLSINQSTINGNLITTGTDNGGGIWNSGSLAINNSTISANSAPGYGGGLFNETNATAVLYHVTLTGNIADNRAAGGVIYGGGIFVNTVAEVANSVLAENYAANMANECGPAITTLDYNFFQDLWSCDLNGTAPHDHIGGDAWLAPLGPYGGPTLTRALLTGSPALNQIPTDHCRDSLGTFRPPDQRGVPRPAPDLCDAGAYEGLYDPGLYNRNLVRNGDAEGGGASPVGADIGVPNWTEPITGFTTVNYDAGGGFPDPATDPVPANRGYNYFAGGAPGTHVVTQVITVSTIAGAIDAGQVNYLLSADLGGYFDQSDSATFNAYFRNQSGATLGSPDTIGPITIAMRGTHTGFLPFSHNGTVPAGTRTILVELNMIAGFGYNDAYSDNLSLVLTPDLTYLFLPFLIR